MKKFWDYVNDKKYLGFVVLCFFALLKLLFNYLKSSNSFLFQSVIFKKIGVSIAVISLAHVLLIWLIGLIIYLKYDQSLETWTNDNKETSIGKVVNVFQIPTIITVSVLFFGFLLYLVLMIFSWTDIAAIFGGMILAAIIRIIYKKQQLKKSITTE